MHVFQADPITSLIDRPFSPGWWLELVEPIDRDPTGPGDYLPG